MTTKNIGGPSLPGDPYYTPDWCVGQCLKHVIPAVCPHPQKILEPGAGGGAFVRGFRSAFPKSNIVALDIDPKAGPWPEADISLTEMNYCDERYGIDVAGWEHLDPDHPFDLAVGNPPFSLAEIFIENSLKRTRVLCFLLRQGFLSSGKRNSFWRSNPPSSVWIIPDRPKFLENAKHGDSCDYAWVVWTNYVEEAHGRQNTNPVLSGTTLHWLPSLPKEARK